MDEQLELLGKDSTLHNVFFAALPDTAATADAADIVRGLQQRLGLVSNPIPPERLHVSLLSVGSFAGSCPPAVIDTALKAAGAVSIAPFKVAFDRVASFSGGLGRRALVLTGHGDGVAGFMKLQDALKQALMSAGSRPPRQSFSPHLTIMYGEGRISDLAIEPVSWTVSRFVLVDSLVGQSRHEHLGQWFL